jgi:hypothetical protein
VKKLKDMSGFGWDDNTKTVTAPNEVWDKLLEVRSSKLMISLHYN